MKEIPKNKPYRSESYKEWIRTLPCVATGCPGSIAHHVISCGFGGGMGTKLGDNYCIPLHPESHYLLHHDPKKWEKVNGTQLEHLMRIIKTAKEAGKLPAYLCFSTGLEDNIYD